MKQFSLFFFCLFAFTIFSSNSSAQAEGPLPPLRFDDIEARRMWRLQNFVQTSSERAPNTPRPVYLQFGFMGCRPCETLAAEASRQFNGDVELVYIHIDGIISQNYSNMQALWSVLWDFAQQPPYDNFTVARRGTRELMEGLCGAGTNPPMGLLILPNGEVFAVVTGEITEARQLFTRFETAYQ